MASDETGELLSEDTDDELSPQISSPTNNSKPPKSPKMNKIGSSSDSDDKDDHHEIKPLTSNPEDIKSIEEETKYKEVEFEEIKSSVTHNNATYKPDEILDKIYRKPKQKSQANTDRLKALLNGYVAYDHKNGLALPCNNHLLWIDQILEVAHKWEWSENDDNHKKSMLKRLKKIIIDNKNYKVLMEEYGEEICDKIYELNCKYREIDEIINSQKMTHRTV